MSPATSRTGAAETAVAGLDVMFAGELSAPSAYVFRPSEAHLLLRLPALLRPGGGSVRMPVLSFVARHPTEGPILIDTGLHPEAAKSLRSDYGPVLSQVFRTLRPADQTFAEQLRGLGVEPKEVKLAVMTHLHADHTSGMRLLPEAEFVCSRREWAAATGRTAVLGGYASGHLPDESAMRLVDFHEDGEPHEPFTRTIDLLGDGSIRLISTPGHTPGHLSVLVRLDGGRQVLLVGDAAYTRRSVDEQILPFFTTGDDRYRASLRELKEFADREPHATLVPFHDETAWRDVAALS